MRFEILSQRLFKTTFQQGRNERRTEAYVSQYVEDLSDVRTMLEVVFNSRLVLANFGFFVSHIRWQLRLRIPFIKQQQVPH